MAVTGVTSVSAYPHHLNSCFRAPNDTSTIGLKFKGMPQVSAVLAVADGQFTLFAAKDAALYDIASAKGFLKQGAK